MRVNIKKSVFVAFFFIVSSVSGIFAQEANKLLVSEGDIKIVEELDSKGKTKGYHLYIKKRPGVESVMLTETTKDPLGLEPNYAYRAKEYNKINGDEIRMLNGERLDSPSARYSLVDSTVEKNEYFDKCFHIYIPDEIVFGYPWSRNGTVKIGKGTFINIRSFEKKYCDYTGKYFDNPYMFDLVVRKRPKKAEPEKKEEEVKEVVLTDNYNPMAAQTFDEISGFMIYSKGPETIVDDIMDVMKRIDPSQASDIVFAIDATGSMKDDIQKLKDEWLVALEEGLKDYTDVMLGLVFYRDYNDNFNYKGLPVKIYPFTKDFNIFVKNVRAIRIAGNEGGDIPEAVYEALYASMDFFAWREGASKTVILIGDAEPHPEPRRTKKYSRKLIEQMSKERNIEINAIITPDNKTDRGR